MGLLLEASNSSCASLILDANLPGALGELYD